ncbi:MAG: hypothetical protein ACKOHJ_05055 [Vulcanococcus sp.]|jgi:hypothetical protein
MAALILLIAALLGINHWLLEPGIQGASAVLEFAGLPWLLLGLLAWLLAGRTSQG